ncbi:MAG TPA: 2Fe-2S iron-sulfur cluster binding domain-containing protein [Gammaproteobacteria bacterium]|nr:2Fe-2S iron-sulfur cluster binding domain-containing protein [Gammaproteobacteria bacterium]
MAQLKFNGEVFVPAPGQSVLDTLLEKGQDIPNSCRAGACQTCLMQATRGKVPAQAQKGLKDSHKARGLFLACSCVPEDDLDVCLPDTQQLRIAASIVGRKALSEDVMELSLRVSEPFPYHAGQYVTLWRDDSLGRSYSLANLPQDDGLLRFHIRHVPGGAFSGWVHDTARVGDALGVQGPLGDCFYVEGNPQQNLLLIGTGTGLAPLHGILLDALAHGHEGEIHLFHGALNRAGLYLHDTLLALADAHDNVHYHACVLHADASLPENITQGDLGTLALERVGNPAGWKSYLCGDPALVTALRKKLFLAGAGMKDIYADAFLSADTRT